MLLIILLLLVDNFPQYINDIIFEKKENYWRDHGVLATAKRLVTTRKYFSESQQTFHYKSNTVRIFTKPSYISIILRVTIIEGKERLINKNKIFLESTLVNEVIFINKNSHPQMYTYEGKLLATEIKLLFGRCRT